MQLQYLDKDGDGRLSRSELMAGATLLGGCAMAHASSGGGLRGLATALPPPFNVLASSALGASVPAAAVPAAAQA